MPRSAILLLLVLAGGFSALASGCASRDDFATRYGMSAGYGMTASSTAAAGGTAAPLDPRRSIADLDCSRPIDASTGGNLRCR